MGVRVLKSLGAFVALSFLAACSTFSGQKSAEAASGASAEDAQIRIAALETENARLKSENARMANRLMALKRDNEQLAAANDAEAAEDEAETKSAQADLRDSPMLAVPDPKSNPDAVVDDPEGASLANGDVPVASSPRLVQSTFASTDAVFENEADGEIATESVLYGVHLASYRRLEEAREGWTKLQRENPDELGLLEPRIQRVDIPDKGVFVRLIGGGFSSAEKASALCARLKPKDVYCDVSDFSGQRLSLNG